MSDLDGTLSPIAPRPEEAVLVAGAADALRALRPRLAVTAFVTGRAAADARRMARDDEILVIGNHGAEWLEPGASEPTAMARLDQVPAALQRVLAAVRGAMARHDDVAYEPKGLSATIHYRNTRDPAAARHDLLAALGAARLPAQLEVREGRMSVELRPRGVDKGGTLRALVERYGLRGLLLFGDDRTDVDAFVVARQLRDAGRVTAFIGAVHGGREVPAEVSELADAELGSPADLVTLLRQLESAAD